MIYPSSYDISQEEQLVVSNMPLVVSLAKSFYPPNKTELDEYIQVGSIGLLKAIRKHNPERAKLSTVAWNYIRWEILRYKAKYKRDIELKRQCLSLFVSGVSQYPPKQQFLEDSKELFESLPNNLTDEELEVICLKSHGYTLKEISKNVGYGRDKVSRILKSAIHKMQRADEKSTIN